MVEHVTDNNFEEFISTNKVAVIDFWAAWCMPCKILGPIIEELAQENQKVAFGKLNVDQNRTTPMKFGIMSIPTLLYFRDGQLVDKTVGALPKKVIEERLEKL